MLSLPPSVHVFIARAPIDMRKSFDALENLVRVVLRKDPMSGHLFVFTNKRRDRIKILMWDRHGWSILYKRLEIGTYKLPEVSAVADGDRIQVEAAELALMLEGIELTGAKRRKRWTPGPALLTAPITLLEKSNGERVD
jgi:transposase